MNTPNNRRRRESIEKIEKTFIELLQDRKLNEISVSDICKISGLNRSTFYANYEDIYDLADKLRRQLEAQVFGLYENISTHDYLPLFRHIRENQLFYKTYFKLGWDDNYPVKRYDVRRAEADFGNRHLAYHIEFFHAGFNAMVKLWLAGGCRETPEEMAEILISEYKERA